MRLKTLGLFPAALLLAAVPFAALPFAAVPFASRVPQPAAPDLILHHGRIITVDAQDRVAQAIAIRGNRIVAVGSDAEVLRLAGAGTRRIDLGGRAVTPGLLDAHAHFSGDAGRQACGQCASGAFARKLPAWHSATR